MPQISVNNVTVTEGDSGTKTFAFTVSLSLTAEADVTFNVATADGTATAGSDYVARSLTGQTIPTGSSTYTFNVTVNGDTVIENNETFFVNITNVSGATVTDGQGQGTLSNDDTTALSVSDASVAEGNSGTTTLSFTVSLTNPAGPGGVSFNIATADGTATAADSDYVTQSLTGQTLIEGATTYTFTVTVNGDTTGEPDETFLVNVTNLSGVGASISDGQGQGTIINDDLPAITVSDVTANEGDSGTTIVAVTVSLSIPAESGGATFDIATADGTAAAGSDYVAQSLIGQTIPAGDSTYTFNVTVNGDTTVENNETFFVNVTNMVGAIAFDNQGQVTLTNDDTATLNISDATLDEGNSGTTTFSFTVSLTNPAGPGGVTFDIATADGTATTADSDYVAQSLTGQTIDAGDDTYTFVVTVNGDTAIEDAETFMVNVTNVSGIGASLGDDQGQGTLTNDDTTTLNIGDVSVDEGNSGTTTFSFTVSLTNPAGPGGVTFDIATADGTATAMDGDYVAQALTGQTISAGSDTYTFDVTVNGDTADELNETFFVNVTNVSGLGAGLGDGQGQGTITNDDAPLLTVSDVTANEGNAGTTTFTFTVDLSYAVAAGGVTFDIVTADGTAAAGSDYVAQSLTGQTIAAGNDTYTFDVTVNGDTTIEDNETFVVNVTNVVGAIIWDGQGQGTITNDDAATLNISDVSLAEGSSGTTTFAFTVSLTNPAGPGGVILDIATADGTATAGSDYVAQSLTGQTIPAGFDTYAFNVAVNGDTTGELDETFVVNVTNVSGLAVSLGDGQGQGIITNDDDPDLIVSDVVLNEGDSGTTTFAFTVNLSIPARPGGVMFDIGIADGTATALNNDFVPQNLTGQTIAAGVDTYTFNVTVNGDTAVEDNETFVVNVSSVTGAVVVDGQGQGTITNDDSTTLNIGDVTLNEGDSGPATFAFTVSLTSPAGPGGVMFDVATADGTAAAGSDYVTQSLTGQTIAAGSDTYTFNVTVNGDTVIEGNETFVVNITNVSGFAASLGDGQGQGTITNDDSTTLNIGDVTLNEGDSGPTNFAFTVSLTNPAGPGGVTFDIATADGTAAAGSDYVAQSLIGQTIAAGSDTYTFDVTVNGDTVGEPDETFFVNVTNVSGIGATPGDDQGQGTIGNDDLPSLNIDTVTANEGDSGTTTFAFTVSLTSPAGPGGVTFDVATADGTAAAGSDYVAQALTGQTIPAGDITYAFNVTVNGDTVIENNETFVVNVTNATGAVIVDGQGEAAITNDDTTTLNISDVTANEGNAGTTTFAFTVSLTNPAGPGGVTFDIATADGTATAGSDYVAQALTGQTIAAGSDTYTFNVTANGDMTVEDNETFVVNVTNVSGIGSSPGDDQGQGTISNDDTTTLNVSDVTANEGNAGTTTFAFTVSLTNPAGPGGVTFDIATADGTATAGSDYVAQALTGQTIAAGADTYTFNVAVNGDTSVENDEAFFVNVTNVGGLAASLGDGQGQGTISNDDTTTLNVSDVTANEGSAGTTTFAFTVSLTNPAGPGGVTFDIATADGTATAGSDYVAQALAGETIAAGSDTYTFNVTVNGDTSVENDEAFFVNVTNVGGLAASLGDGQGQGTITNDDATTLSISDVTLAEGNSGSTTFAFIVSLTNPAGPGGVTFDIATADGSATAGSDYVAQALVGQTIGAGASTYTFSVSVSSDMITELDETFTVNVTNVTGLVTSVSDGQGQGSITNDDIAGVAVSALSGDTTEAGGTATFTVALTSQPIAQVSVTFTSDTTAEGLLSTDGITQQNAVTVVFTDADWNIPQTITVHGQDDLVIDGSITYTITSAAAVSGDPVYNGMAVSDLNATNRDNDGPVNADNDTYSTGKGQSLTVDAANGVLDGDAGGNGSPLQAVLETNPGSGVLASFNPDGSFEYAPNPGFLGTDTFTYHASDGTTNSGSATVTISVVLKDGTIIANDDGAGMRMNTSLTLNVLANDSDPDGNPLHIAGMSQPSHGQAIMVDGQIVYTPATDFVGMDSFRYTAANDFGGTGTATVSIAVWQPVPLCTDFDGSTNEIIRANVPQGTVTDGGVFCRVLVDNSVFVRQSAEVGKPDVLGRGVLQAVDVFALYQDGTSTQFFNNSISVCLQGEGAFLYLDATAAPRTVVELPVVVRDGYTCAIVPNAGTVVLVNGTASMTNAIPANSGFTTSLTGCMVTTRYILNLREQPGETSAVIRMLPYNVTLTAFERMDNWFYVDYEGLRGWVSANYVTPQGTCGP
ncbi:Calx-beta domain-containing protein [Aggregatilinea lenta]|uniref:Calx-beta domain-containing protein n=1 Tax=Aggregatilinea lenta TaxID=913108 RepID=UPI0013C33CDB|nr:Calx-beta domain-containing protein [Aggregatilinea lenta]